MKMITKVLFSTRMMGVMLLIYAFSMAMATFVENDYGTSVAKALIYNCWWFELVMVILVLNFIGNISRYQLYKRKKLPLLVFHLAFIVIFIGGCITRYVSFEGSMHIREGASSNEVVSDATFFKVQIGKDDQALAYDDIPAILLSNRIPGYLKPFKKTFTSQYDYQGQRVKLKVVDFYARAQDSLIRESSGKATLHLVVLENSKRVNKYIPSGTVQLMENVLVSYNKQTAGAINLTDSLGTLTISSPFAGNYMVMASQTKGDLTGNNAAEPFHFRSLYNITGLTFVVPEGPVNGHIMYFEGDKRMHENDPDLVKVEITTPGAVDTVSFYGGKGITNFEHQSEVGGLRISLAYGSKIYNTPFALKLVHFKMDKYPGSTSPAAYSSDIVLEDSGTQTPYKIFMNHVLDHLGYRFFQSSYDQDEKGTVLSVNHDYLGTHVTYTGYTLLFLGMFVTLFWKGTHFSKLNEQLKALAKSKKLLVLLLFLPLGSAFSQKIDMHGTNGTIGVPHFEHGSGSGQNQGNVPLQSLKTKMLNAEQFASSVKINEAHADKFGHLLVQNIDGRIEPVNTMALEILRKLYQADRFYTLDANQFFLSISILPFDWINVPLIKVRAKGGAELLKVVNANAEGYTSMMNLVKISSDSTADFILKDDYLKAFRKKPADQDSYDKDVIELNDKLQAMQQLLAGQYLRVLPIAGDANNTWIAMPSSALNSTVKLSDPVADYFKSIGVSQQSGNWSSADAALDHIRQLQLQYGSAVVPSQAKID